MEPGHLRRLFLLACLLLGACAAPTPTPPSPTPVPPMPTQTPAPSPSVKPVQPFRVIAYATDAVVVDAIPFQQLTHINYAFLLPNGDGSFAPLSNGRLVTSLISRAHANGVKVLVSIGGWGLDPQFEELAASPEKRTNFIDGTLVLLDEFGFDGVDIDWEYPDPGQSSKNYLALMTGLRKALPGKLLTTAVISYGDETGLGVPNEVFPLLDFINVMTYDGPDHATLEQFQKGLDYWLGRGVPPEKLVMGLPFYSRPGEVPYRKLVKDNPANAQANQATYNGRQEYYNGQPMVQTKTRLALQKASGVMFWTLEHDAFGELSLLTAIQQVVTGQKP